MKISLSGKDSNLPTLILVIAILMAFGSWYYLSELEAKRENLKMSIESLKKKITTLEDEKKKYAPFMGIKVVPTPFMKVLIFKHTYPNAQGLEVTQSRAVMDIKNDTNTIGEIFAHLRLLRREFGEKNVALLDFNANSLKVEILVSTQKPKQKKRKKVAKKAQSLQKVQM